SIRESVIDGCHARDFAWACRTLWWRPARMPTQSRGHGTQKTRAVRFPRIVWTSAARKTTLGGTTHHEARSDTAMNPRFLLIALFPVAALATDPPPADIKDLKLRDWEPRSM